MEKGKKGRKAKGKTATPDTTGAEGGKREN